MRLSTRTNLQIAAGLAAGITIVGCGGGSSSSTPTPVATPSADAPVVTTQPTPKTVVAGANVSFTVTATGNGTLSYQWRKDGTAIAGALTSTLSLTSVTAANAGVYDCIVTNIVGGDSSMGVSAGAMLAVNTAPSIIAQPVAQATAPGGNVIFTVAASGNGTLTYQWKKDGVDIAGAIQAGYVISNAAAGHAGSYTCVVTNTLGTTTTSTTTAPAVLTLTTGSATAPTISSQPAAVTVASGGSASFTVAASGNGTVTYQWRRNGVVLAGATTATLSLTGVTTANAGVYDCIVTNTVGGTSSIAISSGAILSVNAAPVILAQPTDQAAALNGSVTFTVVADGNGGTLSYQWKKDGTDIVGATQDTYTIAAVAAGNVGSYTCVVTSTLGGTSASSISSPAALSIATSPLITAQSNGQTVAEGGTASFSVTASGAGTLAYQWYKAGSTLADGGSISGSHTATLTLTGLALADAANYSCIVTSTQGGTSTTGTSNAAALVVVATPVIVTAPAAITVAQGDPGSFSVSATSANGTLSYQWQKGGVAIPGATAATLTLSSVGSADAGNYDCVVTNTIAGVTKSTTTSAAALTVNTSVTIVTPPASVTAAEGTSATLTVSATGVAGGTLSYQWLKNGVAVPGANGSSLVFASLVGADAGSYTCAVTSTLNGTVTTLTSAVAVVAVNTIPVITTAPAVQNVATGSTATFSVVASSTGTLSYQWRKTLGGVTTNVGTPTASYTTPSITAAAVATYDGATYDCVITSTLGVSATTTVTTTPVALNVAVLPTVTIASSAGATPNNFGGGEAAPTLTATVTNSASMNGAVTYQWKKGTVAILGATGATYTLPNATVTLADAGSYTCTVTDSHNGAVANATSTAIVMNVLAAPVITNDLPPVKYQNGTVSPTNSSISVSASTAAGGTLSYQWQVSTDGGATWANVAGATSATYAAPAYPTGSARQYKVIITNTVGLATSTATSAVSTVTLYQTAAITTQPVATNVLAGSPASLSVVPTAITIAGTNQSVQWYKGFSTTVGVAIPGATSATLSIPAADTGDANYYYAIVTNSLGAGLQNGSYNTVTSNIVRLGVNTAPTIVTQPPVAPIATEGASFSLTVAATGAPTAALAYQWQKGGINIPGANGATYTILSPTAADAGSYTCVVTSTLAGTAAQTVTSNASSLTVNQLPTNLTPVVTGNPATGPLTLTVTPTNPNAGAFTTYQWKRNGTNIAGAIQAAYTINEITSTSAGNYTCTVSSVFVATATSNASTATATSSIAAVGVGTGVTTPVVALGTTYTAGKTGIAVSTDAQAGATYEWSVTNGSITAGAGTNAITVTAGTNTALPLTATVVVSTATGGAVGTASAAVVAAVVKPALLAPASVHPGDTWMKASVDSQTGTFAWGVTGAGTVTGAAPTNALVLPFSADSGAVNGDTITLTANVQNAASDAAPTATKTVNVGTGTWVNKDGGVTWVLGNGSNTTGAASAVLANGRVLVCGGQTLGSYTPATAALYDPTTQRWTRVADMNIGRTGHTATALANGTVLVTGGTSVINSGTTYLNSGELYDPITNTWILLTSTNMGLARMGHAATLLTAGANVNKVVITGGIGSSNTADLASSIVVFQASGSAGNFPGGTFSTSPVGLNLPRYRHTATALPDGRVFIMGGQGFTNESYQQAEIFDATAASSSAWSCTKVGSLALQPRLYHSATLLLDGKVLLAGSSQGTAANTAEVFNPADGTFTATAGTLKGGHLAVNTSGRYQHGATRLADGRVLLTGGQGGTGQGIAQSAEIFDPATGLFTSQAPMNTGRYFHSTLALPNGTVMLLGGTAPNLSNTSSTEIFDPAGNAGAGSWTTVGSMNGRGLTSAVRLADGRIMVIGGQNEWQGSDPTTSPATDQTYSKTTQIYDPATGTWTAGASMITARKNHTAVVLPNGKVLVAGGLGPQVVSASNTVKVAELYDPTTNTWSSVAPMNTARVFHGIIVLPDGKVLVAGGQDATNVSVATCEVYDPAANTWTTVGSMSEAKYYLSPTLLSTGKVAIAGGFTSDSSTGTANVELYDPATQTWSVQSNPLAQARTQAFTYALPNGRLLLVGGRVKNPFIGNFAPVGAPTNGLSGAIEVYDTLANGGLGGTVPTNNPFFKTETHTNITCGGAMLSNGKILLAGGSLNTTTAASMSEFYDPATDTLTVGPALATGQGNGCYSVTLANGDVMLIGGSQTDTITQIYRP